MSEQTRELITWVLGTAMTLGILGGAVVHRLVLPYLRRHLVEPVREVQKQVTENHHSNVQPTVLDRIDDVQQDVKTLASVFDGHIAAEAQWQHLFERELDLVRREADLKPRHDDDDEG